MKSPVIARKLAAINAVAKKRMATKPSKRKASESAPNWNTIVQRAADARLGFGYADACERAAEDDSEYNPDGPLLTSAPWGMGAEITNYVPNTPADLVKDTENELASAGKDAVLADCAAFMAETGEDEKTYGWYFATEQMGHGVGLFDYGYKTKIKKKHLFENDNAFLQIEDGRVMFYPVDSRNVKPIDVTDDVEHVLLDGVLEGEDEATEASVKTAAPSFPKTVPMSIFDHAARTILLGLADDLGLATKYDRADAHGKSTVTLRSHADYIKWLEAIKSNDEDAMASVMNQYNRDVVRKAPKDLSGDDLEAWKDDLRAEYLEGFGDDEIALTNFVNGRKGRGAATKTANSGYTMTIKGGEPIDLAEVSAEDVVEALEAADMSARAQHFGSPDIVYTGDFGEVWLADWETAKGTHKEDTTPNTPLGAWCVAQLCTDKGGNTFSPAEVWIALEQRSGITSAKGATKFVKEAQSYGGFDGMSLNEGGGDPQHFHEYIGGEYGYLLDEGALNSKFSEEEIEAMDDAEKGKALLEYFFSESTWYTDGFWMIETHPL